MKNAPEVEFSGDKVFCKSCAKIIVCEKKFKINQCIQQKTSLTNLHLERRMSGVSFPPELPGGEYGLK